MNNRYVQIIALVCALIGGSVFVYKWSVLGFPLREDASQAVWIIEASLKFDAGPSAIKAELKVPALTPGFATINEDRVRRGYGFDIENVLGGKLARWSVRRANGEQRLYYRVEVFEDPSVIETDTTPPFPSPPELDEPYDLAARDLMREARQRSADADTLVTALLDAVNDPSPDSNVDLLFPEGISNLRRVHRLTELLAYERVPARAVRGLLLADEQRNSPVRTYLEIHNGVDWVFYDISTGDRGLPREFFVWWRGADTLAELQGGSDLELNFAVRRSQRRVLDIAESRGVRRGSALVDYSLYSLPIQTQAVYAVLLMVPIGALVMVVLRNFVGVKTFGTFMPVLIALAFRETQLIAGIVLFTLLTGMGLGMRFLLERLRLLLVPRLTAVLIIVVILMLMVSILAHQMGIETGLSVALFPMVIIAMTIERMSIVWEERGASEAIGQGFGSLLVAGLAYLVMGIDAIEYLVFAFPELLLIILAMVLLSGRYTGYRLLELERFDALKKP